MKNNELLDISIDAAILGGKQIMDVYAGSFEVFKKEDESPLTVADQNANEVIIRELKKTKADLAREKDDRRYDSLVHKKELKEIYEKNN